MNAAQTDNAPLLDAQPQNGDVLIERLGTVKGDHVIRLVSRPAQIRCATYSQALARAQDFAMKARVDIWAAETQDHFTLIARHRTARHVAN